MDDKIVDKIDSTTSTTAVDTTHILQDKYNSIKKMYEWGFTRKKALEFLPKDIDTPELTLKFNEYFNYFFPAKGKTEFEQAGTPAPSFYEYMDIEEVDSVEPEEDTTVDELARDTIMNMYDKGEDRNYCLTFVEELSKSPTTTQDFIDALYTYVDTIYPTDSNDIAPTMKEHYATDDTTRTPKTAITPKGTVVVSRAIPNKNICKPSYSNTDTKK